MRENHTKPWNTSLLKYLEIFLRIDEICPQFVLILLTQFKVQTIRAHKVEKKHFAPSFHNFHTESFRSPWVEGSQPARLLASTCTILTFVPESVGVSDTDSQTLWLSKVTCQGLCNGALPCRGGSTRRRSRTSTTGRERRESERWIDIFTSSHLPEVATHPLSRIPVVELDQDLNQHGYHFWFLVLVMLGWC